ncbi:MAG: hypothetical protein EBR09_07170, partial [Proteobacteria bacterium]|nr:hypothetical protein [Pseudomonadota bacterium]
MPTLKKNDKFRPFATVVLLASAAVIFAQCTTVSKEEKARVLDKILRDEAEEKRASRSEKPKMLAALVPPVQTPEPEPESEPTPEPKA